MHRVKMPAEGSLRASRSRHGDVSVPQLPPLSINTMTSRQLQDFVPVLMKVVTEGQLEVNHKRGGTMERPNWWPKDVPLYFGINDKNKEVAFGDAMKKVIRSCYHYLGQEALLSADKLTDLKSMVSRAQSHKQMSADKSPKVSCGSKMTKWKKPFLEIYICFFCANEFSNKDDMRKHQLVCSDRPMATGMPFSSSPRVKPIPSPVHITPPASPSLEIYLRGLQLVPVAKAKKLRASARKSTDLDYAAQIDISEPELPISPTTPKTPKLLISQLSRDDSSHCKRRLSYQPPREKDNDGGHSDSESVASGSSEDTDDAGTPPTRARSLLSIDVSSLLGQRIQKHVKSESNVSIVANAEVFCKTPVKNHFLEKLRKKANTYPVTYKPRKKNKKRPHVHLYCFNGPQRQEQFQRLKTGLNRRSRQLARSMPKCKVVVGRLTKSSINYWVNYRERELQKKVQCVFPEGPTFLSKDIDRMLGLRKKNKHTWRTERSLSLSNVVSEDTNAEVLQQKVTVYRSLLSDLSSSKDHSLISISSPGESRQSGSSASHDQVVKDLQAAGEKYAELSVSLLPVELGEAHKPKQRFPQLNSLLQVGSLPGQQPPTPSPSSTSSSPDVTKPAFLKPLKISTQSSHDGGQKTKSSLVSRDVTVMSDDSISIVTVSSDEDSFTNFSCCTGCRERQQCRCSAVEPDLCAQVKPHLTKVVPKAPPSPRTRNSHGRFLSFDDAFDSNFTIKTDDRNLCSETKRTEPTVINFKGFPSLGASGSRSQFKVLSLDKDSGRWSLASVKHELTKDDKPVSLSQAEAKKSARTRLVSENSNNEKASSSDRPTAVKKRKLESNGASVPLKKIKTKPSADDKITTKKSSASDMKKCKDGWVPVLKYVKREASSLKSDKSSIGEKSDGKDKVDKIRKCDGVKSSKDQTSKKSKGYKCCKLDKGSASKRNLVKCGKSTLDDVHRSSAKTASKKTINMDKTKSSKKQSGKFSKNSKDQKEKLSKIAKDQKSKTGKVTKVQKEKLSKIVKVQKVKSNKASKIYKEKIDKARKIKASKMLKTLKDASQKISKVKKDKESKTLGDKTHASKENKTDKKRVVRAGKVSKTQHTKKACDDSKAMGHLGGDGKDVSKPWRPTKSLGADRNTCKSRSPTKSSGADKDVSKSQSSTKSSGVDKDTCKSRSPTKSSGVDKDTCKSRSPAKSSGADTDVSKPWRPTKTSGVRQGASALRSHSSTPTNSPAKSLKRQASSPLPKSASASVQPKKSSLTLFFLSSSPKKSKSDTESLTSSPRKSKVKFFTRTRSNSMIK